ncbi:O-acetyl-ADP-ribose deacetylase [Aphelenchoides fujianensis]|nr:O-acetyl-ADP-ribose deacetylase [Aphelenchoides fujianensis]
MAEQKDEVDVVTADDAIIDVGDVGDYMGPLKDRPLGVVENEVEVYSEARSVTEQTLPEMVHALFYSKLTLLESTFSTTVADAAINICLPNITDGYMFFDELHALAGPRLIRECQKYVGMQHGSCRVTRAYNANKNFKCIIHTTLPADLSNQRLIDIELAQTAIRRCLNEAISRGAKTIAFPAFFPAFSPIVSIEFVLKVISNWMFLTEQKGELERLADIQILCHSPSVFNIYRGMIRKLAIDFHDTVYEADGEGRRRSRRSRRPDEYLPAPEPLHVHLELSAKLQPSVLVLDDKNGMKRQYRLTNKSKDGRKLYFRCSYCDTLIRKTNIAIRAKITLQDGAIVGDHYPEHHPDCKPKNSEELIVQQLDRKSRRDVKEGRLTPRDAYEQARRLAMQYHQEIARTEEGGDAKAVKKDEPAHHEDGRVMVGEPAGAVYEDENLELAPHGDLEEEARLVEGPETRGRGRKRRRTSPYKPANTLPHFPAWQQIRQQYFRMRKVGEYQKQKQEMQRAEMMREATFVVADDEEGFVEVDEMMDPHIDVDVMTVEPRSSKPRILQQRPGGPHRPAGETSVIKVDVTD